MSSMVMIRRTVHLRIVKKARSNKSRQSKNKEERLVVKT